VPYGAEEEVVQAAYRKLAMEHHPDRNGGAKAAEERFKAINDAYDRIKRGDIPQPPRAKPASWDDPAPWRRKTPYSRAADDMLNAFRAHHAQKNRDVDMTHTVTLEDAFRGKEATLVLRMPTGTRQVPIRIPAGVESGVKVRIPGAGENIWPTVPPGDLNLTIFIAPHPRFGRAGAELHLDLPVPVMDALLGADLEVTGIDGQRLKIAVPSCVKPGLKMRVPGHGMPDFRTGRRGDLILNVDLKMPISIDTEGREILEKFRLRDRQNTVG
jgi:curved DNA-binding protein